MFHVLLIDIMCGLPKVAAVRLGDVKCGEEQEHLNERSSDTHDVGPVSKRDVPDASRARIRNTTKTRTPISVNRIDELPPKGCVAPPLQDKNVNGLCRL